MQLWARLVPPAAACKLKLLPGKKGPQFHICHCQNLTVPWRARLKFVHPSRLIQRKSLVSWWKKVEHGTQSRTHAMMQIIDYRFELSKEHIADNQLPVRIHAGKNSNVPPYPNCEKVRQRFMKCDTQLLYGTSGPTVSEDGRCRASDACALQGYVQMRMRSTLCSGDRHTTGIPTKKARDKLGILLCSNTAHVIVA